MDVGPEACVPYLKGRLFRVVPASHLRTMAQSNTTSQWKNLRNKSSDCGTRPSTSLLAPESLMGWYCAVWDSHTEMENTQDFDEEETWLELIALKGGVGGRFRWWRKIGTFKALERDEGVAESLWVMDNVKWSPLDPEDEDTADGDDWRDREAHGHGLAALSVLDDEGYPFLEQIYNEGLDEEGELASVRVVWKKLEGEGLREPLTAGEINRLISAGTIYSEDF